MTQTDAAVKFRRLARDVKAAGNAKELRRELYAGLNRACKPVTARAQASAVQILPRKGGLGRGVAGARFWVRKRGGAKPGVTISGKRGSWNLAGMDDGAVRKTQKVRPGWWSDAVEPVAEDARREVVAVLDRVAEKLTNGSGR